MNILRNCSKINIHFGTVLFIFSGLIMVCNLCYMLEFDIFLKRIPQVDQKIKDHSE